MVWREFRRNFKDSHKIDFRIYRLEKTSNNNLATLCELKHFQTHRILFAKKQKTDQSFEIIS